MASFDGHPMTSREDITTLIIIVTVTLIASYLSSL